MQDYNIIIGAIQMRLNKCPTDLLWIVFESDQALLT